MTGQRTESTSARSADSSPTDTTTGGIFNGGLEAYRTVTQEDYRALLTSGLVVLDANALLNLYKYHAKTRKELLALLALLGDRLWIPYQAMFEFWENRIGVIEDQAKELALAIDDLEKYRRQFEERIRAWTNRIGLSSERAVQVIGMFGPTVEGIEDKIRELSVDDALERAQEDTAKDPVITAISTILQKNVALPLPADELIQAKEIAKERYRNERPPGWKDAKKKKNPEGDYLIWRETLEEAKRRNVDVLFVTGDVKDDWWRKERGEAKGPLPELTHEMRAIAHVRLFMLRPESFLLHAGQVLEGASISSESVQDAQRVTVQTNLESINSRGLIYERKVSAAILDMGYSITHLVDDFMFDLAVEDYKDRRINVELKSYRSANKFRRPL